MTEYWAKAFAVWFIGFFPLAEIYVAVPAGMAMGLDVVSAVVWGSAGNYAPVLLLHYGYEALARQPRLAGWLARLSSEGARARLERHGFWFVLLVTPWTGVWIMAATVKLFGMRQRPFLVASLLSIVGYAVAIGALLAAGIDLWQDT